MKKRQRWCFLAILWAGVLGSGCLAQGGKGAGGLCATPRRHLRLLDERLAHATPVARRSSLLRFLKTLPDDPEDCVTTKAESELLALESQMIRLKVGDVLLGADWLLLCGEINEKTQHCGRPAPYADDIPHSRDERLIVPHALPQSERQAEIAITRGVGCSVLRVSVAETEGLLNGGAPRIVSRGGEAFDLSGLQGLKYPVVIAAVRCEDGMGFRKAAWSLR